MRVVVIGAGLGGLSAAAHLVGRGHEVVVLERLVRPLAPAIELFRLGAFRKLDSTVSSYFDDPRLRQLFSFQSMYTGLSPSDALAVNCVNTYMDSVEGMYFPKGGVHAIPQGLAA